MIQTDKRPVRRLRYEYVDPATLTPYENNPRKNDSAVPIIEKSIGDYDFLNPIILTKDGVVISGHTRLKAALELGLEAVPVIWADHLSEQEANEFRLVDNKTNEVAEWDLEKLNIELKPLVLKDFDLASFGFSLEELDYSVVDAPFEKKDNLLEVLDEPGEPFEKERPPHLVMCPHCGEWHEI